MKILIANQDGSSFLFQFQAERPGEIVTVSGELNDCSEHCQGHMDTWFDVKALDVGELVAGAISKAGEN